MVQVAVTNRTGCRDLNVIPGRRRSKMFEAPVNSKGFEKKIYINWRMCGKLHSEKTEFSLLARYY